jgi:hypothetical protein
LNAKTLVKIDDDVVVNTKLLLEHINAGKLKLPLTSFRCRSLTTSGINRDKNSPYYVSFYEYERDREFFEKYCAGSTTIVSNDIIPLLNNLSYTTRDFRHDDVYLGMIAAKIKTMQFIEDNLRCEDCINDQFSNAKSYFFLLNVKAMSDHRKAWENANA